MRQPPVTCIPALLMLGHTYPNLFSAERVSAFSLEGVTPGIGLLANPSSRVGAAEEIVIFEHTELGTGGLVLNSPTPIILRDLAIPRFRVFGTNPLMLGCGIEYDDGEEHEDDADEEGPSRSTPSTVSFGDMSPWFWLHDLDDLPGSYQLEGADGFLYMGGNIEDAAFRVQNEGLDPTERFKFFWKYKAWGPGELEDEVSRGRWTLRPQDPRRALRPYTMTLPI